MPPKGSRGSLLTMPLTKAQPQAMRRANRSPRAASSVQTLPPRPKRVSLAIRAARRLVGGMNHSRHRARTARRRRRACPARPDRAASRVEEARGRHGHAPPSTRHRRRCWPAPARAIRRAGRRGPSAPAWSRAGTDHRAAGLDAGRSRSIKAASTDSTTMKRLAAMQLCPAFMKRALARPSPRPGPDRRRPARRRHRSRRVPARPSSGASRGRRDLAPATSLPVRLTARTAGWAMTASTRSPRSAGRKDPVRRLAARNSPRWPARSRGRWRRA
jgi:hypothetical protein